MIKIATAAAIEKDGQFLLGLRKKDGLWEFPGGKIDPGETPEQCVVREIKEELDLVVEVTGKIGFFEGTFRNYEMQLHGFFVRIISGEPKLLVHSGIKWVKPEDLNLNEIVEEDRELIPYLKGRG